MKNNKKLIVFILLIATFSLTPGIILGDDPAEYTVLPIALRTPGIGFYYGIGVSGQDLTSGNFSLAAAKLFGQLDAEVALMSELEIFSDSVTMGFGAANANEFLFDISYTRAMAEDQAVTLVGNGVGYGAFANITTFDDHLVFPIAFINSSIAFEEFQDQNGSTIPLPGLHLGKLNMNTLSYGLVLNFIDDVSSPSSGIVLSAKQTDLLSSTDYSDTRLFELAFNGYIPFSDDVTLVVRALSSDATITREGTTDEAKIKDILSVDCSSLTGSEFKACNDHLDNLVSYISAHNEKGTARPLGGSSMLRSYRESRFRGAHSRFLGSELRINFPDFISNMTLQFALFAESGNVADELADITTNTRNSYGAGTRVLFEKLIIRLDVANGDEGSEWSLMVGNPW